MPLGFEVSSELEDEELLSELEESDRTPEFDEPELLLESLELLESSEPGAWPSLGG